MEDFFWDLPFVLCMLGGIFLAEVGLYFFLKKNMTSSQLRLKILLHILIALIGFAILIYKVKFSHHRW